MKIIAETDPKQERSFIINGLVFTDWMTIGILMTCFMAVRLNVLKYLF